MNKGFKVLSSVLAMSMVLASGVFAVDKPDYHFDKDEQDQLAGDPVFATATKTNKVEKSTLYQQVYNEEFKKALKEYDKAFNNLKTDVGVVAKLGDARCDAQFALDSANNQLLATNKLVELAEGIKELGSMDMFKLEEGKLVFVKDAVKAGSYFAKDATQLKNLVKENNDLVSKLSKSAVKLEEKKKLKAEAESKVSDLGKLAEAASTACNAIKDEALVKDLGTDPHKLGNLLADLNKVKTEADQKKLDETFKAANYEKLLVACEAAVKNNEPAKKKFETFKAAYDAFTKEFSEVEKIKNNLSNEFNNEVQKLEDEVSKNVSDNNGNMESFFGQNFGDTLKERLNKNIDAFEALSKKFGDKYQELVKKVKDNYGTREAADRTVSALTVDAATAAAKINLLNDLAKQYKVTLRTCYLADYTAKVSDKAAKAEDKKNAKKDDVPNTASYFTIFVPTCQLSAPAVKYYGAAQVYDKVLRRPLVCKKVETKVVEVPRFTFDELTAYDVACCCCK